MCTRRETSTSVVVSDVGAAKVGKERGHLVILWSAMIRLSKCEELTTVKPVHVHTLVHLGTVLLGLLSVMQHR
jgi:hypothetical protein